MGHSPAYTENPCTMLGRARGQSVDAPKEEEGVRTEQKEFTTKAEYNRWLVRQENAKSADATRDAAKAGEEIIKERQRRHTTQGLSRQQAAMVQMKKASESLEAHRQQNLTHGRKVYEEVSGWRVGAKATKEEWAKYGKSIREAQKAANSTAASVTELNELKKSKAAITRQEDQAKEAEREKLRKQHEKDVQTLASQIRTETSDSLIDAAKRHFYEQRLKSANDTKSASAAWAKERAEKTTAFRDKNTKLRNKSKSARASAGKSREALLTARAAEAAALREKKRLLSEAHKERMQSEYLEKAGLVKSASLRLAPSLSQCTFLDASPSRDHPATIPRLSRASLAHAGDRAPHPLTPVPHAPRAPASRAASSRCHPELHL